MGSVNKMRIGLLTFLTINSLKSTSISSCLACIPQFFVRLLSSLALLTSTTGGYVSSMKKNSNAKDKKPMKLLIYSVHRHPR
jgi:predicted benzoate:H+ symporter BenE